MHSVGDIQTFMFCSSSLYLFSRDTGACTAMLITFSTYLRAVRMQ